MIYVIIPINDEHTTTSQGQFVQKKVLEVDKRAFTDYAPQFYAVRYEGLVTDLSKILGFGEKPELVRGIVLSLRHDSFGYASTAFWNWVDKDE